MGYWEERGAAAAADELDAVCYAGAPGFLNTYAAWSQRHAVDALLRRAAPLAGRRCLDVGCGTGRWSRRLLAEGAIVVGVDASAEMVREAARLEPRIDFRKMDIRNLDLPDDSFDLAIAITVLQHLPHADQACAVAELTRVVSPGGLVLTIDRDGRPTAFAASHLTFPRPRAEWLALWRAAGATPVEVRGQEFSYPLALARLGRPRTSIAGGSAPAATRRGVAGWRRRALRALVAASYAVDAVVRTVAPRAPAEHVAALYRVD